MRKNSIKKLCTKFLIFLPLFISFLIISCSKEVVPINFGTDMCDHCMMTIVDKKFGGEIMSDKGKPYKFDAIECMIEYEAEKFSSDKSGSISSYTIDILNPGELIKTDIAYFVFSESIKSPMSGNLASYSSKSEAEIFIKENGGNLYDWNTLKENFTKK